MKPRQASGMLAISAMVWVFVAPEFAAAFAIAAAIVVGSSVRVGAGVIFGTICAGCAAAAIASLSSADGGAPATCPDASDGVSVVDVFYK